jgi:hypothetical protein
LVIRSSAEAGDFLLPIGAQFAARRVLAEQSHGFHNNTATTIKVAVLLPVAVLQVCHTVQHRHFRGGGGVVV